MTNSSQTESSQRNKRSKNSGQRQGSTQRRRARPGDDTGVIPVLARAAREVETAVQKGPLKPTNRARFQVAALLLREERARVKTDATLTESERANEQKRLDGLAGILAKTAARDTSLLSMLGEAAPITPAAKALRRDLLIAAGVELSPDELIIAEEPKAVDKQVDKQVVPASVRQMQMANPFLAPDFSAIAPKPEHNNRLANWELIDPLFRAFEHGSGGGAASMELPEAESLRTRGDLELMRHQARFVEVVKQGHRTFLLADEPGLGKTAQALMAAEASNSYPLLVVVPNVVKTNWEREVELWTPGRSATVVHGDGDTVDAFSDVVIVNYEVLDRHVGWLGRFGFKGMVVDEAHFIKNLKSERSKHVLSLSQNIRATYPKALLMALTGTPLINSIEDFRAIWQFLGWIDGTKPLAPLMSKLEDADLTPADPGFFSEARRAVIDMGIVRRKKVDVAADIPARRVADIPVELDNDLGRSIRAAEQALTARLVDRFTRVRKLKPDVAVEDLIRVVAHAELEESKSATTGENVFTMVRRIGQAKATLAADYTAQLARSVGKVVFFAKHIDVMDTAEAHFAKVGLKAVSIRGDQSAKARQNAIDSFANDPEVSVVVASLTAAGVGLNLQAASNVVLAELSWTNAEQTQAIDRVHRIGQELPVTAWRIIAAHTIDARIAELIDSKAGLAARALDGSDEDVVAEANIQLQALSSLLRDAIKE
ncbi:DEAD/DEAH box helicase [Salinibacterium sp. UTAS2018]|uniref:DEAD/DEAH box helicase n=1 Tax=unclassified Salinibacterium TaxID=2632331 RepID=UPI0010097D1C|nr:MULTISPECIES: DEAD/DEAH box helicase [unclassified Salinibacterium]MBH0010370.1 DEAD/DEAH box helicase [Salinibacterium sp. SWN1162]QAV69047.1 DEAD/DEAH box helicase [Salinibacterium sp. UTAS2018]